MIPQLAERGHNEGLILFLFELLKCLYTFYVLIVDVLDLFRVKLLLFFLPLVAKGSHLRLLPLVVLLSICE